MYRHSFCRGENPSSQPPIFERRSISDSPLSDSNFSFLSIYVVANGCSRPHRAAPFVLWIAPFLFFFGAYNTPGIRPLPWPPISRYQQHVHISRGSTWPPRLRDIYLHFPDGVGDNRDPRSDRLVFPADSDLSVSGCRADRVRNQDFDRSEAVAVSNVARNCGALSPARLRSVRRGRPHHNGELVEWHLPPGITFPGGLDADLHISQAFCCDRRCIAPSGVFSPRGARRTASRRSAPLTSKTPLGALPRRPRDETR